MSLANLCILALALTALTAAEAQANCKSGQCTLPLISGYQSLRGAAQVMAPDCPVGTFLQAATGTCKPCSPGRAKSTSGAGSCKPCKDGHFAAGWGNKECAACPPGTFVNTRATPLPQGCVPCPANTYQPAAGSSSCLQCPRGQESQEGAARCHSFATAL
ncbi:hypothetical protein V8C86DRAFT_2489940 [Haematococcus lacustris]